MEENSSNALLMAGGVLIGVMILSLVVFVFTYSANVAREYETKMEATNIATFNRQFEVFEGRNDITIHDIVSLANLARQINTQNDVFSHDDPGANLYHISIKIEGIDSISFSTNYIEELDNDKIINLLTSEKTSQKDKENSAEIIEYTCKKIEYSDIGKVNKLVFKKN